MRLDAKTIQSNYSVNACEIGNSDWEMLCDAIIQSLLNYFIEMREIEQIANTYRCEDNGILLEKWLDYTKINDVRTMRSFIYAIESNRSDFMRLLIAYEMMGVYHMMMYGMEDGCFSYGQTHDIYESLTHIKCSFAPTAVDEPETDDEYVKKCNSLIEKVWAFFNGTQGKYSIMVSLSH